MHTLEQVGIDPLIPEQMTAVGSALEGFLRETPVPIKVNDLVEIMQTALWPDDFGGPPTRLELMSAVCTLRDQGKLNIEFVDSIMYVDGRL